MDYLQYLYDEDGFAIMESFKPYYKWITFNIVNVVIAALNNGSFKPYYKWITFNINLIKTEQLVLDRF